MRISCRILFFSVSGVSDTVVGVVLGGDTAAIDGCPVGVACSVKAFFGAKIPALFTQQSLQIPQPSLSSSAVSPPLHLQQVGAFRLFSGKACSPEFLDMYVTSFNVFYKI